MFYRNCGVTVVSHVTHPITVHRTPWTITCLSFWFWRSEDQKHFWKCLQVSHGGFIVCCTLYSSFHLQKCAEWLTRGSHLDSLVGATFWPPGTYADPIFRLSMSAVRTTPKAYKLNAGSKKFASTLTFVVCGWIWDFWLLLRFSSSYGRFLLHTPFLSLPATLTIFLPGRLLVRSLSLFKCLSGIGIALLLNVKVLLVLPDTASSKVRFQVTHVVGEC